MKVDRSHVGWLIFATLATFGLLLLFLANQFPHRLPFPFPLPAFLGPSPPIRRTFGGTPLGLIFGVLALAIFVFAAALGLRRKQRQWPLGNAQWWLRAHLWLSALTLPLVLLHCGFRSGGWHTSGLMILYIVVMASGFFGLFLQQILPRYMRERLPREVVFEAIPYLRRKLAGSAVEMKDELEQVRSESSGTSAPNEVRSPESLARFLEKECIPYLSSKNGRNHRLCREDAARCAFAALRLNVAPVWKPDVERLQKMCDERRMMDSQARLHHLLHGWLLVHVPASLALLVATSWHAIAAMTFLAVPQ